MRIRLPRQREESHGQRELSKKGKTQAWIRLGWVISKLWESSVGHCTASTGLAALRNVFHGCDLQSLPGTRAGSRAAGCSAGTLGGGRCAHNLHFMSDMFGQFGGVSSELVRPAMLVGQGESAIGTAQTARNRLLASR